jgi:hypothetical protein
MPAMKVLKVYLRIYADCFGKAFSSIGKNPWTLLLPVAVMLGARVAGLLAAQLGVLAGLLVALATAALFSSYLYFVRELIHTARVSLRELRNSIGAYFWSILNVFFVIWLARLALSLLVGRTPNAGALMLALWIVAVVALNATPEVIYLRGTYGGLQTIAASWEFLKAHWIPWFAVNVPLLAAVALVWLYLPWPFLDDVIVGAALHVAMVFRGYLFRALDGSSHRQRMFLQRVA